MRRDSSSEIAKIDGMEVPETLAETGESVTTLVPKILESRQVSKYRLRRYVPKTDDAFDEERTFSDPGQLPANVELIGKSDDERALVSLSSKVDIDGERLHLPLIDFSNARIPDLGIADVEATLLRLGQRRGFILHSGRCFHYYGLEPLTEADWQALMMRSAEEPSIGEGYIRRQLPRGASYLRQNTGPSRPHLPHVVKVFSKPRG